ncbi:UNVERIFIED_CONTAM: hypothetical protein FKN15_003154 [Acipenser sinensis]
MMMMMIMTNVNDSASAGVAKESVLPRMVVGKGPSYPFAGVPKRSVMSGRGQADENRRSVVVRNDDFDEKGLGLVNKRPFEGRSWRGLPRNSKERQEKPPEEEKWTHAYKVDIHVNQISTQKQDTALHAKIKRQTKRTIHLTNGARRQTRQYHTDLVSITSKDVFLDIEQLTTKNTEPDHWIGLRKNTATGSWFWENGETFNYTYWKSDEPKNELCTVLKTNGNDFENWIVDNCDKVKSFICYKACASFGSLAGCPNRRYHIVTVGMDWDTALQHCRSLNMELVSILNAEEQEALFHIYSRVGSDMWIGLKRDVQSNFKWSSNDLSSYRKWASGQPDNSKHCGTMTSSGEWKTLTCTDNKNFICVAGHVCDQMEYTLITKMMSQREALSYCRQHYTDLLSFTNQNGFLGIKREILKTTKLCWIGLRRTSKKDPWLWENGETLYYTNWIRGEPRDKLCAVLDVQGIYLNKWKTEDCGSKKNFICYKEIPVPRRIYLISENMFWPNASQYCNDKYTGLVKLTSQAAQDDVAALVGSSRASRFWIGLMKNVFADSWYWVADMEEPLGYTNWALGQPSMPYFEHCVGMVRGADGVYRWHDMCCFEKLPFICFQK